MSQLREPGTYLCAHCGKHISERNRVIHNAQCERLRKEQQLSEQQQTFSREDYLDRVLESQDQREQHRIPKEQLKETQMQGQEDVDFDRIIRDYQNNGGKERSSLEEPLYQEQPTLASQRSSVVEEYPQVSDISMKKALCSACGGEVTSYDHQCAPMNIQRQESIEHEYECPYCQIKFDSLQACQEHVDIHLEEEEEKQAKEEREQERRRDRNWHTHQRSHRRQPIVRQFIIRNDPFTGQQIRIMNQPEIHHTEEHLGQGPLPELDIFNHLLGQMNQGSSHFPRFILGGGSQGLFGMPMFNVPQGMTEQELMQHLEEQDEILRRNPLSEHQKQNIPIQIYHQRHNVNPEDKENFCSICLYEFEEGDELAVLPCLHRFHKNELWEWFKKQKTCPIDKHEVKLT